MFFYWFVVIASNIPIHDAAKLVYKNLYSVAIPPGYRFATPKRKLPLGQNWYEVIYKPLEDSFLYALDNIASDREPIGWEYYDDTINNRKQEIFTRSVTPAHSFTRKVKKAEQSFLDFIHYRCRGLLPKKAERCLARYKKQKLIGQLDPLGFSMGYYDESWRLGPRVTDRGPTEDFDDMDESPYGDIFLPNPVSDEEYDRSAKTESAANKLLRSPGDYGNYDSETYEEDKVINQNDVEGINKVYIEITGDKNVNKQKIIKFVTELKEKLELYSSASKVKQNLYKDYTRSNKQKYAIEYISSKIQRSWRPQRPSFFFTIKK